MTQREYNKQWKAFVRKTELGYILFAQGYTKNLEDAKDLVYSVYGKLCQKDYDFKAMEFIGMTAIRRNLTNKHRDSLLKKNNASVVYLEDLLHNFQRLDTFIPAENRHFDLIDKYSDIESELDLKNLTIQITEPNKSCNKASRNSGQWPFVDKFIGF